MDISQNTTGQIEGYLIVWGSANQPDLQGEYFTPETELESQYPIVKEGSDKHG